MKKKNIISALALTLVIGMGATAYAASNDATAASKQGLGIGRITSMRGYDYVTNVLKSTLGLSDEDITAARDTGKTPYELAEEKALTKEEFHAALLEAKLEAIDAAVEKGTIEKEEAEALKASLKTNMENCTGNFGQGMGQGKGQGECGFQGQGRGQGRRMMGNGQGRFK